MKTMTRQDALDRAQALMERERRHLRDAYRAQRKALEAEFFGDEADVHAHLEEAYLATNDARVCAEEVDDLLGVSTDSSSLTGSTEPTRGGKQ